MPSLGNFRGPKCQLNRNLPYQAIAYEFKKDNLPKFVLHIVNSLTPKTERMLKIGKETSVKFGSILIARGSGKMMPERRPNPIHGKRRRGDCSFGRSRRLVGLKLISAGVRVRLRFAPTPRRGRRRGGGHMIYSARAR